MCQKNINVLKNNLETTLCDNNIMFDDRIGLFHGRNLGPFAAIFQYFYDRFFYDV